MNVTARKAGLGIAALAMLMLGGAAIADNMGMTWGFGDHEGRGMMGQRGPALDLSAADADKDGRISPDELTSYRAARVAGIDADADGKLSADEIAAMHLKEMTSAAKAMADNMVAQMDTDGDKLLSAAEMLDRPLSADIFERLDANADGFIDATELSDAKGGLRGGEGRNGGRGRHSKDDGEGGAESDDDRGN